jgi:hypothetical protein
VARDAGRGGDHVSGESLQVGVSWKQTLRRMSSSVRMPRWTAGEASRGMALTAMMVPVGRWMALALEAKDKWVRGAAENIIVPVDSAFAAVAQHGPRNEVSVCNLK